MIEVLREGEPTLDGRFICQGAIVLPDEPVPLFDYDVAERSDPKGKATAIGALFNFARGDDNRIYCEATLEDERTVTVTVAIDEREVVAGEDIGVLRARIIGGIVGAQLLYPWPPDR